MEAHEDIVSAHGGVRAFFAENADADIALENHADVIGAVADSQAALVERALDQAHGQRLLLGRAAIRHHRLALQEQAQELRAAVLQADFLQQAASDQCEQVARNKTQ